MEKGFYKYDGINLIFAPNKVEHKEYVLKIEDKEKYTYPIDGWRYFETEDDAKVFFEYTELIIE
jgi:hypothetical protein